MTQTEYIVDDEPTNATGNDLDIAIIGMTGRFPGAADLDTFWRNLREGVESISFFDDEQVIAAGVDPAVARDPSYVKAGGVLDGVEYFDAAFFGFAPREAEVIDPQQRIFLECAWEALEHAGYNPESYAGPIGVYAGASLNTYLLFHLLRNREAIPEVQDYHLTIANDKDFLPTRVSYKLNLRGPSVNVQTACSTSLVAVHQACQSLLNYQCDMALAGGVAIRLPQQGGYPYEQGSIASPDGHCRAFDAEAAGTVPGNGIGIVVLKRLQDALDDGDTIHAVIKASAINNDGAGKVGYTAPSIEGQAEVIAATHALAEIAPETISYIEAHGTGTKMGDPIEIAALKQAFASDNEAEHPIAIGSLKTNIGHLDAAAGVAGLIKTTLALKHSLLPPSLHYTQPNPAIGFADSSFYVNTELRPWERNGTPRRAGVSSFGIGGTNAHVIVEEAPYVSPSNSARSHQLLVLSARSEAALDAATDRLRAHLSLHPELHPADVAYTLQVGRKTFSHRRMVVCASVEDAVVALDGAVGRISSSVAEPSAPPIAFMFSGQGAQYVNMARDLYAAEPTFREQIDRCAALLRPLLQCDLRTILFPSAEAAEQAAEQLNQTWLAQPALFVIEYALAQLWQEWGVEPTAMIGHSIGEYVAATLAGVFSLDDALEIVAARGRLMQTMPGGAMLSVSLAEHTLRPLLSAELALAAINGPMLCTVSGPADAIERLEAQLTAQGTSHRRLHTSHAFHSAMMEPMLRPFEDLVGSFELRAPEIPFVSNLTGDWITTDEATDPHYWATHLRETVRFADGLGTLLLEPERVLLEVGSGQTLTTFARQHAARTDQHLVLASLRHPHERQADLAFLLAAVGKLWLAGIPIDWSGFYTHERRQRVPLPTYPFERQRYWVEAGTVAATRTSSDLRRKNDITDWFYAPSWSRADLPAVLLAEQATAQSWLVFGATQGVAAALTERLSEQGHTLITVLAGERFAQLDQHTYTLDPRSSATYALLISELAARNALPTRVLHLWGIADDADATFATVQDHGFHSLIYLAQALGRSASAQQIRIDVLTTETQEVTGDEIVRPERATVLGPILVMPQEYANLACRAIDIVVPEPNTRQANRLIERLITEITADDNEPQVAYRGQHRWVQRFATLPLSATGQINLRDQGVYLITGGLGNIGLVLAEYLAATTQATLILLGRSSLPPRDAWSDWLRTHDADDPTSGKLRRVEALEALGAQVVVIQANVADQAQMQAVVDRIVATYGAIHGVIHAAGFVGPESLQPIAEFDADACEQHFQSKVRGTLVLAHVLRRLTLDFCILQSSLSAVLGGVGMAAYAAANRFMDAFAQRQNQRSATSWLSVNWDGWHIGAEPQIARSTALAELAINTDEGVRVFERLLAVRDTAQIIVSTADVQSRRDQQAARSAQYPSASDQAGTGATLYSRPTLRTSYVAPRTALEQTIAEVWSGLLGIGDVGIHDDFFELGGHSLLATQIISRLRDLYRVELPLRSVFETPTVAGLATVIAAQQPAAQSAPTIRPVARDGELPLSFVQQRLWFLDQLEPGSPLYNNPAAVQLSGRLDITALEQSIREIVRRHEVLRTTFSNHEGRPVLVVADEPNVPLQIIDLRAVAEAERADKVQELAAQEAQRPFDLQHGPLLRVTLLRLAHEEQIVLLTMHHLVSDGWSIGVLIKELAALYTSFAAGAPSALPELPVQYADFAAWQRAHLQGDVLDAQIAYWREQLRPEGSGELPVLQLPTDRPRPAIQTFAGRTHWFTLPSSLSAALNALAQREEATPFMILLAAFQVVLARYSGQDDICVGTPIAGRTRAEAEPLIGCFVNTLVLRSTFHDDLTFQQLVQQVREKALGAYAHQDVPFEMLVDALQPQRDLSHTPLFQVMFVLQNAPTEALELPGLRISTLEVESATAKFDLSLSLEATEHGLRGWLNYNTDLFDAATMTRLLHHFEVLLHGIVADPAQPVAALPLLRDAEQRQLLIDWNATGNDLPQAAWVHQAIQDQAARTPDATAVVFEHTTLSYRQLNRQANQLARYLLRQGVARDTVVGVCAERSTELIVALLAILKAGATYLPLDPSYPADRIEFMMLDSRSAVILTQQRLAQTLPTQSPPAICLDTDWALIAGECDENLDRMIDADDVAYIIYTSGSTGQPKGVQVTHEAIAAHCRDVIQHYALTAQDRVLQFAALNFDASLEQILPTLIVGARLVLRESEAWTPSEALHKIAELGLTVANLPTAYWHQLAQAWADPALQLEPHRLRLVIVGGDVIRAESVQLWHETPFRAVRLLNAYGPTETTITATTYEVTEHDRLNERPLPIGRPLPNRSTYILDRLGNPVPIGVAGELHIGGPGVARGYLNRPELTAERFVERRWTLNDSTTPHHSGRLYRSGDLARYLADGTIEFLGRVDHQIKLRGFRIELGEIEAVLQQHPQVRETVVIARDEHTADSKRIVAYVVGDATLTSGELRGFLAEQLPSYMLPSAFVLMAALPLTPSGKIDRRALPAPDSARPEIETSFVAPRTPVEQELAEIWQAVLNVERIGIHDNFFELGGHSLLATQLVARIRTTFQVELPVRRLFETPTVAELGLAIAQSQAEQEDDDLIAQALAELEQLSDEDVQALLTDEMNA